MSPAPPHRRPAHAAPAAAPAAAASPAPAAKARFDRWIAAAGTPANRRASDPSGDQGAPAADTQSECAVAAFGERVVVAWNDSKGLRLLPPTTVTSFAWSCDGGATFTDGGDVPLLAGHQSFGNCTLDVDVNGNFYMSAVDVALTQDIAVYRGRFDDDGCTFQWFMPIIVATGAGGGIGAGVLDKPYLCVDPANGNVYCSYTRFAAGATAIEVVRGTGLGATWSNPVVLENATGVQGSRPFVGPEGNLYVAWQAGWGIVACDLSSTEGSIRVRRSLDPGGAMTFAPAVTAGTVQHNWLSYWAGNLRGSAAYFPDLAIDRSGGPNDGSVYVIWNEAASWGPPGNGSGGSIAETEANNQATDANVKTLLPGDNATGTIGASADLDYWKLTVSAGQHILMRLEPQGFVCGTSATTRNFRLRMYKGLAASAGDSLLAQSNVSAFASEIVFDAAENATYYLRVQNVNAAGTTTGTYTLKTRLLTYDAPSPARDMRDIVMARSTDLGTSFHPEIRVNDSPAGQDECIPAIAVDRAGIVHAFFYDSRHALGARILRHYMHASSLDGAVTWQPNQRVTSEESYFNFNAYAIPNYGDYNMAATATGTSDVRVHTAWSDERLAQAGTSGVDAYTAAWESCVEVACPPSATAAPGDTLTLEFCVANCGSFSDDFAYTIADTRAWCSGAGSLAIAAGGQACVQVDCVVPQAATAGEQTTISFAVVAATSPVAQGNCALAVTAQEPPPAPPPPAVECYATTAQWTLDALGGGSASVDLTGRRRFAAALHASPRRLSTCRSRSWRSISPARTRPWVPSWCVSMRCGLRADRSCKPACRGFPPASSAISSSRSRSRERRSSITTGCARRRR